MKIELQRMIVGSLHKMHVITLHLIIPIILVISRYRSVRPNYGEWWSVLGLNINVLCPLVNNSQ